MNSDRQKLLELLESDGPRLHALLTRLTLREGVAEDLMQELFLRLLKSSRWATAPQPTAYVWQSAIHLAFEWRRRRSLRHSEELLVEPPSDDLPAIERLSRMEQYDRVLAAATTLDEALQEVFVMRYIQQMLPEEIAKQLGTDAHNVRALCSKALSRIRQTLGESENCNV